MSDALQSKAILKDRDYTIIVAKTAPSVASTPPGYANRWAAAHTAILQLAQLCETFDPDGISLYISCRDAVKGFQSYQNLLSEQLKQVLDLHFPPDNLNLLDGLTMVLERYFAQKAAQATKPNGAMILVLIDGEPQDRIAIARLIVHATQKLDRDGELGIGFVQLGDDLIARGFLNALDENLQTAGAKFDVVHTTTIEDIQPACLVEFLQAVIHD
jgi:hypothetical protein